MLGAALIVAGAFLISPAVGLITAGLALEGLAYITNETV